MYTTTAPIPNLLFSESTGYELASPFPPRNYQFVYNSSNNLFFKVLFFGITTAQIYTIYSITAFVLNRVYKPVLPTLPKIPSGFMYILIAYYVLQTSAKFIAHPAVMEPCFNINNYRQHFLPYNYKVIPKEDQKKLKRCSICVNGMLIDVLIVYKTKNLHERRWMLCSNCRDEYFETQGDSTELKLADELECNCIFYNYPNVGCSEGKRYLTRSDMIATHQAMHAFVKKQFDPRFLVDFGSFTGGCIQGESLKTLPKNPNTQYVFVKYLTCFSSRKLMPNFVNLLMQFLNWKDYSSESSKTLEQPEVIIQKGKPYSDQRACYVMQDKKQLLDSEGASLAFYLWDEHKLNPKKTFLLVQDAHFTSSNKESLKSIAEEIKNLAPTIFTPNHLDAQQVLLGICAKAAVRSSSPPHSGDLLAVQVVEMEPLLRPSSLGKRKNNPLFKSKVEMQRGVLISR